MPGSDIDLSGIITEFARGAARADLEAHMESADTYEELEQQFGPEIAAVLARDWGLVQRVVRLRATVMVTESEAHGLLRILIPKRVNQEQGWTVEVEDQYVASGQAPPRWGTQVEPEPPPVPQDIPDALRDEVQKLLLRAANVDEKEQAGRDRLQVGAVHGVRWHRFQRRVLKRLGWPTQPPAKWPTEEVRAFLREALGL